MTLPKSTIDSVIEEIKNECVDSQESDSFVTLTLWVPKDTKDKFTRLQDRTNRKLGKELRKVVVKTVDVVLEALDKDAS